MTCGIYMIKNKQTGQIYIGQSIDINKSKSHCNKTGYFRVVKSKSNTYKDGYYYRYSWRDGDKIKSICAPSLDKLERKVKREGYIWRKL